MRRLTDAEEILKLERDCYEWLKGSMGILEANPLAASSNPSYENAHIMAAEENFETLEDN